MGYYREDLKPSGRDQRDRPVYVADHGGPDSDWDDITFGFRVPLEQVLPRGRTAKDVCPSCFTIPASNGQCQPDCEWMP